MAIGFRRRQPTGGSSHYTLDDKTITIPYKRPYVKVIYIKKVIMVLEELGFDS